MPCILCIAVFAMLVGAITTSVLDSMNDTLTGLATGPVRRTADTESVARFDLEVPAPVTSGVSRKAPVPVAVTVHKQHKRVRIQVLTHAVSRAEAELIEDRIAAALGLQIVSREDAHVEEHADPAGHLSTPVSGIVNRVVPNIAKG